MHAPAGVGGAPLDVWSVVRESKPSKTPTLLERIDLVLTQPLGLRGSECGNRSSSPLNRLIRCCRGLTILELMVTMMGFATLMAIALPVIEGAQEDLRLHEAVTDIQVIQFEVITYEFKYGTIPETMDDMNVPEDILTDPWGRSYQYLNYVWGDAQTPKQKPKKDQFLKPINTAFDIYSMGPDGETAENLNSNDAKDDIIRAADGEYLGVAEEF